MSSSSPAAFRRRASLFFGRASGFPALRDLSPRARRFQLDSYLRNAVDRDVHEQGLAVRRPEAMLAWLRAYAAATATTASYSHILDAATPGQSDKPARSTSIASAETLYPALR